MNEFPKSITLYNETHSRAVVITLQDKKTAWANLYVNAKDGISNATITTSRWQGKTEKGAKKWAAKKLDLAPGFKTLYGREPIAGKDYDPNNLCQDDYEYLTGTGRYL